MSFLKPKTKLQNTNVNNELLTSTYTPGMQQGANATNFLGSLLTGQGDVGAAQGGFDQYLKNAGYENALARMTQGVTGGNAAQGLLRSGATSTSLLNRGTELNQGMFNNYLGQLGNLSGIGQNAGNLVSQSGQRELIKKPSTAGTIASAVGGIASIFSDPRLKRNAVRVGQLSDGLGIWRFRYLGGIKEFIGVMADEVAKLRPWACGPDISGYRTVNMGAL